MKRLRILVLMHPELIPPDDLSGYDDKEVNEWKTEYDVVTALQNLGHEVEPLGISDELRPLRVAKASFEPHIVFNLLEEFRGQAIYDQNVVGYLELLGFKYTGCNPRGLVLARGKALSKKILSYHRIRVPAFAVFPRGRKIKRPPKLRFPLIVKSANEDASIGISRASIVYDEEKLEERVRFVHETVETSAIAEEFIEGRDVYVGVIGNTRLRALPPQELVFKNAPPDGVNIATAKAKHDVAYQTKWGIDVRPATELTAEEARRLASTSKRIYRALMLDGYARIDYRVDADAHAHFLEANPNPDLARFEEFASAAEADGIDYSRLVQTIVNLGVKRGG